MEVHADTHADQFPVVATGIVVLLTLLVVGPTSALGAIESDPDVRLMVAIGAAPTLRRRLLGLEAGVQALMASLIGIPTTVAGKRHVRNGDDRGSGLRHPLDLVELSHFDDQAGRVADGLGRPDRIEALEASCEHAGVPKPCRVPVGPRTRP